MTTRARRSIPVALAIALALATTARAADNTPAAAAPSPSELPDPALPASVTAAPEAPASEAVEVAAPSAAAPRTETVTATAPTTRSGREIYQRFREGLADPACPSGSSPRWRQHFAAAPTQLATREDDLLPLFGYVVDALRAAHLPTEYALIPFVESGYRPDARSPVGPAGLWQFIAITARNHNVAIRPGYDGRLSPVDSTRAAVRYLKTLHGMFAGDWRLAAMAYNAGEYRVLGSLRRAGQNARNATPETLPGLTGITHAYVKKLRALSCLMTQADDEADWLRALDRPVPVLAAQDVGKGVGTLDRWARQHGLDPAAVRRLNPVFAQGRLVHGAAPLRVLAPLPATQSVARAADAVAADANAATATPIATGATRSHTVRHGESAWTIARRYGIATADLLTRNRLTPRSVLKPGMVLAIDATASPGE